MGLVRSFGPIDIYGRHAGFDVGLRTDVALAGGSSICYAQSDAAPNATFTVHAARRVPPHRFLSGYGYMRWIIAGELPWGEFISNPAQLGYYFLASQEDVSGTSGVCYAARFAFIGLPWRFHLELRKYPDGLAGSGTKPGVALDLTLQGYALANRGYLAVEWLTDLVHYGGVRARCWIQEGLGFQQKLLSPILTHVFPETVQPQSFGEGEFVNHATVESSANAEYIVDQVGRFAVSTF